ncbi:sigma-54-dependent transcriptional regulator [Desulfonatronovibrio hydrogenovorans]|uniref:sigma-54-dependent transcriptional regulator n=1 Tax=Desulfonatronovibrio hydrogenovorans TaxID=53245 RepID=UPI00048ECCE2|nr:sigma-54 dependent transcriptional regulator [Desulfonatronovibrio hydrogenovorans]
MQELNMLIVDDEKDMLDGLKRILPYELDQTEIKVSSNPIKALELIRQNQFDLILMDVRMPEMDGIELLEKVKQVDPDATIVMMTAYGSIETAVQAIKMGAYDFITKPFDIPDLVRHIKKGLERSSLIRENMDLRKKISEKSVFEDFVGQTPPMKRLYETIQSLAHTDYSVLIRGESGTGKELVARAIHSLSSRSDRPLVTVNCPAIPEHLLESELFGHKKGSFTGALKDHKGLFVEASGSSLLLDEIADIPVTIQTKLLRALQEQEIRPLGSSRNLRVDARILSTTNQDLEEKIKDKSFREDLFYRLNVVSVSTPPLREIMEDIPLLVHHFNRKVAEELGSEPRKISTPVLDSLMRREWPGNVRELQNFVRRMVVFSAGDQVDMATLQAVDNQNHSRSSSNGLSGLDGAELYAEAKSRVVNQFTENYVREILSKTSGNISHAAKLAGMSRVALQKILRRLEIDSNGFRERV